MRYIILLTFFVSLLNNSSKAQSGTLDQSFGVNGKMTTDFDSKDNFIQASAIQADGKIVVVGYSDLNNSTNFQVTRYKTNGFIDSSFGTNGKLQTPFDGFSNEAYSVVIQPDQKIVVAGYAYQSSSGFGIVRYLQNGNLDSSFGTNGKSFFAASVGRGTRMVLQSDGKFILSGDGQYSLLQGMFTLIRVKGNGSIDSSFGVNGFVTTTFDYKYTICTSLAIQSDGKIIAAGGVTKDYLDFDFILVSYTNSGVLDSTFGKNGIVLTDMGSYSNLITSAGIQSGKKIVVTGAANTPTDTYVTLARYLEHGTLDSTFGTNGIVITTDFLGQNLGSNSLTIETNDEIIVGGTVSYGVATDFALIKYKANGSIDSTFGIDGKIKTDFQNNTDLIASLSLQQDGKIIAAGYSIISGQKDFAIARYNNNNILPITLSSFTATKKQNSVLLNWQTASENNNAYFSIEHCNNNSNFKELGKVNAKGNSTQLQQYSFEDRSPENGTNYYRLKQVNKDGTTTISKTILLDFSKATIIKLYPNPVKNVITIEGLTGSETMISIIDINGRVLTTTSTDDLTYTWNIKAFPPGIYYLRIEGDNKVNAMKFVKE